MDCLDLSVYFEYKSTQFFYLAVQCYVSFTIACPFVTCHFWQIWLLDSMQEAGLLLSVYAWRQARAVYNYCLNLCTISTPSDLAQQSS